MPLRLPLPLLAAALCTLPLHAQTTITYIDGDDRADPIALTADATLEVDTGTATQSGAITESGGAFGLTKTSRLGCQIIMTDKLDGLTVRLPTGTYNAM